MDGTLIRFILTLAGIFFLTWQVADEGPWTALSFAVLALYTLTTLIDVIVLKAKNRQLEQELIEMAELMSNRWGKR